MAVVNVDRYVWGGQVVLFGSIVAYGWFFN